MQDQLPASSGGPVRTYTSPENTTTCSDSRIFPVIPRALSNLRDSTRSICASDIRSRNVSVSDSNRNVSGENSTIFTYAVNAEDASISANPTSISVGVVDQLFSNSNPSLCSDEVIFLLQAESLGLEYAIGRAERLDLKYLRVLTMLQTHGVSYPHGKEAASHGRETGTGRATCAHGGESCE